MNDLKQVHVRQVIAEQTCFDERFKGLISEALVIKLDGSAHIKTTDNQLIPYENKTNSNEIFFGLFRGSNKQGKKACDAVNAIKK